MTAHDCTTRDGLATVNAEFLIIRLARTESADRLTALALDARQRGLFQMSRFAQRMTAVGPVPGRARLVHVVGVLTADDSDSIFEREVRARLLADGFRPSFGPTPVALPSGSVLHLDITFPEERVAVECQGFLAHHDRRQLDRDARRDNALAIAGNWLVLKLTWDRFRHDWEGFAAELRSALAARTRAR